MVGLMYVVHCGDDGEPAKAVPGEDGRWHGRCPRCGTAFVIDEEGGDGAGVPPEVLEDDLARVGLEDPLADATPAGRLRALLDAAYGAADRLRAIGTLCESWYRELSEAEDDAMHRITELFVAGDLVYVTLEIRDGACRFDARGVLVSEPTAVFVWTLAWGPGTRFADEVDLRLAERFGDVAPPTMEDCGVFHPFFAWWSPGLWRVGYFAAITPAIDEAQVADAVRATRGLARRVASLAVDPAAMAPSPSPEG
jgi:hypothetical protein